MGLPSAALIGCGRLHAVCGIDARIVKVPLELLRHDLDAQGGGCRAFKALTRPDVLSSCGHHDVEDDEEPEWNELGAPG